MDSEPGGSPCESAIVVVVVVVVGGGDVTGMVSEGTTAWVATLLETGVGVVDTTDRPPAAGCEHDPTKTNASTMWQRFIRAASRASPVQ